MAEQVRPVIVMQTGPLHLFWTTGVFYLWTLKKQFDFVLIVSDTYKKDVKFKQIQSLLEIKKIVYLPSSGLLSRHHNINKKTKIILQEFAPKYILLNNWSYIENQYLMYWAKQYHPKVGRYCFQNGRASLNWSDDFLARFAAELEQLLQSTPALKNHPQIAKFILNLKHKFSSILHFKLIPLKVLNAIFDPPVNVHNGKINLTSIAAISKSGCDFFLAYLDNEINAHKLNGIDNIVKIKHPAAGCYSNVFEFIFQCESLNAADIVLIMPSYGFSTRLIAEGWSRPKVIDWIASRWCDIILFLRATYPGYLFKIKLHPSSANDATWAKIIDIVIDKFPELSQLDPNSLAELHVVQSKIIVSDVSSVLWWAGFLGEKVPISFDIFNYPGGDEMRHYVGLVTHVNSLTTDLLKSIAHTEKSARVTSSQRSVAELLK